jgi:pimeloyl-ACP methyl ester carboxylesterase
MKRLVTYWSTEFDWRAQEEKLNQFPQFTVQVGDIDLHYLHVPAKSGAGHPLLLSHGWPGSIFEFIDLIPRLTEPERFGGSSDDAFTVLAPRLPGYGLSFRRGNRLVVGTVTNPAGLGTSCHRDRAIIPANLFQC